MCLFFQAFEAARSDHFPEAQGQQGDGEKQMNIFALFPLVNIKKVEMHVFQQKKYYRLDGQFQNVGHNRNRTKNAKVSERTDGDGS